MKTDTAYRMGLADAREHVESGQRHRSMRLIGSAVRVHEAREGRKSAEDYHDRLKTAYEAGLKDGG